MDDHIIAVGGNSVEAKYQIRFPHSLGLLLLGIHRVPRLPWSGEYKVMGLAPYGEPRFEDLILRELVDLKPDGSFG